MAALKRIARMNRIYIVGDTEGLRNLLNDFRARHDESGYWLPIHCEPALRAAIAAEPAYQAARAAERTGWDRAKSVIPMSYKTRHGAMYGGRTTIGGESIDEPPLDTSALPWQFVAQIETRARDLTGTSTINGRVKHSSALYEGALPDGRIIYRISDSHDFGDDLRETYYLPPDLWERLMEAEVRMRGITREKAAEWLAQYRGCVGTELYEYAAARVIPAALPAQIS
jgi:hypothetical protein